MNFPQKKASKASIASATEMSAGRVRSTLARAEALKADNDKERRLSRSLCLCCHYIIDRIGGAAITRKPCGICGEDQTYGSTSTDQLCLPCAKENGLCKHCGGDVGLKSRRKPYPFMQQGGPSER